MAISRSNKETFVWLKRIKLKDITQENLVEEADYFVGAVKTKRRQTVQAKLVEFVEKEASLRVGRIAENEKKMKCTFYEVIS